MGSTASIVGMEALPERVDLQTCKKFVHSCKEYFDEELFNEKKESDDKIPKSALLGIMATTDVFLTHDWGKDKENHKKVRIVNKGLQKCGITTWLDDEQMLGNIRRKMTNGIDNAQCVLVFITKRYMEKLNGMNSNDNCLLEFNYACQRKTGSRMIPIVMEKEMLNPSGWVGELGMVLGSHLYVNMTGNILDEDYFSSKISELYDMIIKIIGRPVRRRRASNTAEIASALTELTRPKTSPKNQVTVKLVDVVEAVSNHSSKPNAILMLDAKELSSLSSDEVIQLLQSLKIAVTKEQLIANEVDGEMLSLCETPEELLSLGKLIHSRNYHYN